MSRIRDTRPERVKQLDKCIQILHVHDNHWAVITTLGCDLQENKIRYYDSSYTELLYNTEMLISRLVPEEPEIKVDVMKLTKQIGSNDCGLYAIAIATALAYEVDPSTSLFEQNDNENTLGQLFYEATSCSVSNKENPENNKLYLEYRNSICMSRL